MANQPEVVSYDSGVYQIEVTDPVDGGVGAKTNAPLLALANRTAWLKKHVDDIESGTFALPGYALLLSPNFTGIPTAPTQAAGDNTTKLATDAFVQTAVNGSVSVSIAGGTTTTLTAAQAGVSTVVLTGAVTANKAVVVPASPNRWLIVNNSTGAFVVTIKTAAGTGVRVTAGNRSLVYCDGTNVYLQQDDFFDTDLLGTPIAPTAAPGTSTNQVATTSFATDAAVAGGVGRNRDLRDTPFEKGVPSDLWGTGTVFGFARGGTDGLSIPMFGSTTGIYGTLRVNVHYVDNTGRLGYCRTFETSSRVFIQFAATAGTSWLPWAEFIHSGNLSEYFFSPALTGNPTAPTPAAGDNDDSIATSGFVQTAVNGVVTVNAAGSGSLTLTAAQYGNAILRFTGVLTGNKTIVLPATSGRWQVVNLTTGNFNLTLKTLAGTGVLLPQVRYGQIWSDGNNVNWSDTVRGVQYTNVFQAGAGTLAGTLEHIGGLIQCSGTSVVTFTLPDSAATPVPPGGTIRILNWSTQPLVLGVQGSDKMNETADTLSNNTNRSIPPDTYVDATYIGSSGIWLLTGTGVSSKTRQFAASLTPAGYRKLPSGDIEQWGTVLTTVFNNGSNPFSFPIPFPAEVLNFECSAPFAPSGYVGGGSTSLSAGRVSSSSASAQSIAWRAIGR
jgi:hypothetical protein